MFEDTPHILQWASLVVVPIVLGLLTLIGAKVQRNAREAAEASKEAADSVRPNGTGHRSQTAMIEDVLMHIGEVRGDVKDVKQDIEVLRGEFTEHVRISNNELERLRIIRDDLEKFKRSVE